MRKIRNSTSIAKLAAAILTSALLWPGRGQAQTTPTDSLIHLSGVISDTDGVPIDQARFTISVIDPSSPIVSGSSLKEVAHGVTDSAGSYAATLPSAYSGSRFRVTGQAAGYVSAAITSGVPSPGGINLRLMRQSSLGGRITDAESRPVPGLRVRAMRATYNRGRRLLWPSSNFGVSDEKGYFVIKRLPPGDYLLEISPETPEQFALISAETASVSSAQAKSSLPRSFYPSGNPDYVSAIAAGPGATVDVGDIQRSKTVLFSIDGLLPASGCRKGQEFSLSVTQRYGSADGGLQVDRAGGIVPCGRRFTVANLAPGTYRIRAEMAGPNPEQLPFAFSEVVITDKDVELTLDPGYSLQFSGIVRLMAADHSPRDLTREESGAMKQVRLRLRPITEDMGQGDVSVPMDDHGRFRCSFAHRGIARLEVEGLASSFYVARVVYNGIEVAGSLIDTNPFAMNQSIEVTLSNDASQLDGKVMGADGLPGPAAVFLVVWPLVLEEGFPVYQTVASDEAGVFRFGAIKPGGYRVIAVSQLREPALQAPGILAAVALKGQNLTLKAGEKQSVTLSVDPQ